MCPYVCPPAFFGIGLVSCVESSSSRHIAKHRRLRIAMKATVFSTILVLTSHNAGAFVSHLSSLNNLRTQHERRVAQVASNVRATATSRVARRRHLHHTPCVMSAAGGDNSAEAGDKEGEEESTVIPPGDSDVAAADEASGAAQQADCLQGQWHWDWGWRMRTNAGGESICTAFHIPSLSCPTFVLSCWCSRCMTEYTTPCTDFEYRLSQRAACALSCCRSRQMAAISLPLIGVRRPYIQPPRRNRLNL